MDNTITQRVGKVVAIQDLLSTQTLHLPVSSEDVELTQEEIDEALQLARVKKSIRLDDERKKELARVARENNNAQWTIKEMWRAAKMRGDSLVKIETGDPTKEFNIIEWQRPIIHALSLYFTNNPEFEKLDTKLYNNQEIPFSLNKGIWLFGPPGTGKTLLMDMFRINKRLCYGLLQCAKIAYAFAKEGEALIRPQMQIVGNGELFPTTPFGQPHVGICYNDLGTEPVPISHYQNKINVMEQIILSTYDKRVPYWHRHITTNLTSEQVEKLYGVRVKDRVRQMFNILDIRGTSLRK